VPDAQIAFRLLGLLQKLRRANDPQVRQTLKGQIDTIITELEREQDACAAAGRHDEASRGTDREGRGIKER
jgi:hypothetical protein